MSRVPYFSYAYFDQLVLCVDGILYVFVCELYRHLMSVMSTLLRGPTEGVCSMVVPAMSTSALRMPSTHPAISNANHR